MKSRPKLVAIVGGSGAGKSWLSRRLQETLEFPVATLSLDDFYRDQSHLELPMRERVNFDHPRTIDWELAEAVLRTCRAGRSVRIPQYNFSTHTRSPRFQSLSPQPIILVDGLWLLWRPGIRRMFDFCIYLQCPARLRLERRLERDRATRGRDKHFILRQFKESVAPMHKRFVTPQACWADVVLRKPPNQSKVEKLGAIIREMVRPSIKLKQLRF